MLLRIGKKLSPALNQVQWLQAWIEAAEVGCVN